MSKRSSCTVPWTTLGTVTQVPLAPGGWFSRTCPLPETVWRRQCPRDFTSVIVSESNRTVTLANSDLEMAAVVLHLSIIESVVPSLRHKYIFLHSDNTPSVAWVTRMATKTATSHAAHRLVQGLALRQPMLLESSPCGISHVAGTDKSLADIALRLIPQIDTDSAFLMHFDSVFPLQNRYWRRTSLLPNKLSNVILTLRGQRLTKQWWSQVRATNWQWWIQYCTECGIDPFSGTSLRPPGSHYCWALLPGLELNTLGKAGRLHPKLLKKPYVTWHKPSCWKDTVTPEEPGGSQRHRFGSPLYPPA